MTGAPAARAPLARLAAFGLLAGVPLAVWTGFSEPFTPAKWGVLHLGAAALLVTLACGPHPAPQALVEARWPLALAGAVAVLGCFRGVGAPALDTLAERLTVAVAVTGLYWFLAREGDVAVRTVADATALATAATAVFGLLQAAGHSPWVIGGSDQRSAFFGNANMAAQYLAAAVPLLLARRLGPPRRAGAILLEAVLAGALAYAWVLGSRSALLALALALATWLHASPASRAVIARTGLGAVALVALVHSAEAPAPTALSPIGVAHKERSTTVRSGLWQATARLVADHPLGVGAGRFEESLPPYLVRGPLEPDETLVYRSPHSEPLRLLAEDGWVMLPLVLVLGFPVARHAMAGRRAEPLLAVLVLSLGLTVLVEATFQFPFALASGCLIAALTLALALRLGDAARPPGAGTPAWPWVAASAVALVLAGRVLNADRLSARGEGREAFERACTLDPRHHEACVMAAWRQVGEGDLRAARSTLEAVLRRAPYYAPALKLLGETDLWSGDREGGCLVLWLYDGLYRGASSVRRTLDAHCPLEMQRRFAAAVPRPHPPRLPHRPPTQSLTPSDGIR